MTQHTPGPWETDEREHDCLYQNIKIKCGQRTVCTVWIDDAPCLDFNAEQEANARLIAAAPDLLVVARQARDALTALRDKLNGDLHADERARLKALDEAIAKATGQ